MGSMGIAASQLTAPKSAASGGSGANPANEAGFYGPGLFPQNFAHQPVGVSGTPVTDLANRVYAYQFILPCTMTVKNIAWYLISGNVGATISFGIYDVNKNLLFQSSFVRAAGQNLYTAVVPTQVLPPGAYWFAQTSSDATANGVTGAIPFGNATGAIGDIYRGVGLTIELAGIAANAATAGSLPASLGVIANPPGSGVQVCLPLYTA